VKVTGLVNRAASQSVCSIPKLACSADRWIDHGRQDSHFDARHSLAILALNSTENAAIRRCCDPPRDHLFRDLPVLMFSATRPAACSQMAVRFRRREISGSRHDPHWKERSWWPPAQNLIFRPALCCRQESSHCLVTPDLTISMALLSLSGLNHSL
jgi:hypothetical protein